jgi:hypothetical protein
MIERLDKSGQEIEKRLIAARDRDTNRETLAHITGIEQWGQRRLKIALGELPVQDEYDNYRPQSSDWDELRAYFRKVRQQTLALSRTLRMAGIDPDTHILHNQFGNLTLLGWLYYLHLHASLESKRIR